VHLDDVRRDWTKLGAEDPLWAVLVAPGKRGGRWDIEEFLATGRADVDETVQWLQRLGLPTHWPRVLDFGCGVGRLSQALAKHADEVIGVDIAPSMLDNARRLDRSGSVCRFVLNDTVDLSQFTDGYFDLVYSALVLQHLPRQAIDRYLIEFLRVLRPGGIAFVQVPTRPQWTVKGAVWRFAPHRLIGWGQRRVLGYPAAMRMTAVRNAEMVSLVAANDGEIVGQRPETTYTTDWWSAQYLLRRSPAEAPS
jgi:ubiquinone/menaquinone biosynthesis C-methylase UbiE